MLTVIIATLIMGSEATSPAPNKLASGNLGEELYYASDRASGIRLCDRKRAARLHSKFNKRFGYRISSLKKIHEATYGRDPDFIVTSSCARGSGYGSKSAITNFDLKLRDLERKYGGY